MVRWEIGPCRFTLQFLRTLHLNALRGGYYLPIIKGEGVDFGEEQGACEEVGYVEFPSFWGSLKRGYAQELRVNWPSRT